jgi:flagellar basal body-associated protein FliL
MKKPLVLTLMLFTTLLVAVTPLSVRAEDEPAAKSDSKKGGGEEGDSKKKSSGDVTGGKFEGDPIYVHLEPMILPVITDKGAEQIVTLIIDVEVRDFDVADQMHTDMPRVRDSLMRALYGGLGEGSLRDGKLADVAKIKAKAMSAVTEIVGADGVKDVLIQGIAQRML